MPSDHLATLTCTRCQHAKDLTDYTVAARSRYVCSKCGGRDFEVLVRAERQPFSAGYVSRTGEDRK